MTKGDGHYFISYSRIDGREHASRVADSLRTAEPPMEPWLDEQAVVIGRWDDPVDRAISACKAVLLIVTDDSVESDTVASEFGRALQYKKPVLPLRFASEAALPLQLQGYVQVDFSTDYERAIADLRTRLRGLDSPDGRRELLQQRLRATERDSRRALSENERTRAEQERVDIEEELRALQGEDNLSVDRLQEESTEADQATLRTINRPPAPPLLNFQDRVRETDLLREFLDDPSVRLLTVIGRAGVGKTTMVCQALNGLDHSPGEIAPSATFEGIVYMGAGPARDISFSNFFEDLCRLLPEPVQATAASAWRESPGTDVRVNTLTTLFARRQVVVLLDNLEDLIDQDTGVVTDREFAEVLRLLLVGPHHGIKAIITTREAPRELALLEPARQLQIELDAGLPSPHAENLLRLMDRDGRVGLRDASDEVLDAIRQQTLGYPRALEAFFAVLRADRFTSVEELLGAGQAPDNVVETLVAEAFSRLDGNARAVVQALAVYGHPVAADAVEFLLPPGPETRLTEAVLRRLAATYLVRFDQGRYYLHPVDRAYALSQIEPGAPGDWVSPEESSSQTLSSLRFLGAEYLRSQRPSLIEGSEDLEPAMVEFELRSDAGDVSGAIAVLFDYADAMLELGHRLPLIQRAESVYERASQSDRTRLLALTGFAFARLGDDRAAIERLGAAIEQAGTDADPQDVASWRLEQASCLFGLRQLDAAIDELNIVLATEEITEDIEGYALLELARIALTRGDYDEADSLQRRALTRAVLASPWVNRDNSTEITELEDRVAAVNLFEPSAWTIIESGEYMENLEEGAEEPATEEPISALIVSIRATRVDDFPAELFVADTLLGDIWLERASLFLERADLQSAENACQLTGAIYESLGSFKTIQAINLLADIRGESEESDGLIEEQERYLDEARARGIRPTEADVLAQLGQTYLVRDRLEDAEGTLRDLEQLSRQEDYLDHLVTAESGLARIAWVRDDAPTAVARIGDLLSQLPRDEIVHRANTLMLLADIEESRYHHMEAANHYEEARGLYAELGDWQPMILTEQSLALMEMGVRDYDSALRRLEGVLPLVRSIGVPSVTASVLANLVEARLWAGDRAGARAAAAEAEQLGEGIHVPASIAQLAQAVGNMWTELEDYESAIKAYERAQAIYRKLGRHAEEVNVWFRLTYVLGEAQRYDSELSAATQATQLAAVTTDRASMRSAQIERALALGNLSRYDEALSIIDPILKENPSDPIDLGNAAWVLFLAERYEDSLQLTKRALEIDPNQEWLVRNLAHSLLALHRPLEAEAHYRAAIENRKGGENFRRTIREVRRLLDRHPDLPGGQDAIALLEAAQAELP